MKRRILTVLLSAVLMLLSLTAIVNGKEAETVYLQALPSENKTATLQAMEDDKYNILKNSDFEIVDDEGKATHWTPTGAVYGESIMVVQGTKEDPAPSGNNFLRLWHEDTHIGARIESYDIVGGETYELSVKFRCPDNEKRSVAIYISTFKKDENGKYVGLKDYHQFPKANRTEWTEFSCPITLEPEAARLYIWFRLLGGGEVHADDFRFVGKLVGDRQIAEAFRAQLNEEAQKEEATNKLIYGDISKYDAPYPGQENLLKNGGFDENNGTLPAEWGLQSRFAGHVAIEKNGGRQGDDCLKIVFDGPNDPGTAAHPFIVQNIKLQGGAEYQVSYWYKTKKSGGRPTLKLEYHTDRSLPGAQIVGEAYNTASEIERNGEWVHYSHKVYPAQTVREASVLIRVLTEVDHENEFFFDDVELYMTQAPPAFEVTANKVFYYTDDKTGTFLSDINIGYYPELAEARVDYAFLDADWKTVIWEKKNVMSVGGKTEVSFPVSLMKEKEVPYRVRATLYNTDGSVHSIGTQNVYLYDRPKWMGEDGMFLKGGKTPVDPIIGYHVVPTREGELEKSIEAVNTIQIGAFATAESAVNTMDMLEENGVMGMVVMYPGMKCAGNEANIDKTVTVVNALKDHPAVIGYIVMDEVFLHGGEPSKDLEASYRLIHSLDKNHPVTVLEAMTGYYEKAGKYVDMLLIDPYSSAKGKRASDCTKLAYEAVNYEKPVFSILETMKASSADGYRMNTGQDARNNNWQALISGAKAIGYFSINDAETGPDGKALPLWNASDGGDLWNGLTTFAEEERDLAFAHFVHRKTPEFNAFSGEKYRYASWVDGKDVYMIVLGFMDYEETVDISIPLESFAGTVKLGNYTATLLAGGEKKETITGSEKLDITLRGVDALFYKITPLESVDFSGLGATKFLDLEDFEWAREQIARMDAANVITGRTLHGYAPAEKITRSEFAGFLIRALGLTADSTELFADVAKDDEFAKEISIGKALGILKGTDGVNFNPTAEISRQDLMVIAARGMRLKKALEDGEELTFTDKDAISDYAVLDVAAMVRAGIVAGYTDGTVQPLGNTTRAEAAVIMDRICGWNNFP